MTLQQLHFIDEVVKRGSINQAAKHLFVAQSSISNTIRDLETELGITIFFRHNLGMRLTREGQILYDHMVPLLEQERKINALFTPGSEKELLSLSVSSLHFPLVTKSLTEFVQRLEDQQEYRYEIRLKENNIQYIMDDVESGQSDIGIFFISSTTEDFIQKVLKERNLTFHKLVTTVPHAFMGNHHPLAQRTELSTSEFGNYPYVVFDLEYTSSYAEEMLIKGFDQPEKIIHLSDRASVYGLLRHTHAYSIGSGALPEDYSDPSIVSVPITRPIDRLQIGYIHPARKKPNFIVESFVSILDENLQVQAVEK